MSEITSTDYQQILSGGRNLFGGKAGLNAVGQFIAPGASPFGLGGIGGVSGFGTGFGTGYPGTGATLTRSQREQVEQDLQRALALRARAAAANDPRNFGAIADRFRSKVLASAAGTAKIEGSRLFQTTNDPNAAASLRLKLLNDATRQANDFQRDLYSPSNIFESLQRGAQLYDPASTVALFENVNRATGTLTSEQKRIRQAIREQMERARLMQLFGLATQ